MRLAVHLTTPLLQDIVAVTEQRQSGGFRGAASPGMMTD
jgi:hypothetical protein